MSDILTKRMLPLYESVASPTLFLSGMFQSSPRNFHNSAEVEIDIKRSGEPVSIVVQDLSTEGRYNSSDIYTNKRFKPPIHKEKGSLNAFDLINRQAGNNPFEDIDFQLVAMEKVMFGIVDIQAKINRAIELQASQVLQTGILSLKDENGNIVYTLDYKPKATHFPTVTTDWTDSGATPIADLKALAEVIRNNGLMNPDLIIMGCDAWENFVSNAGVKSRLDNRRIDLGTIVPFELRGNGGSYRGTVDIGNYKLDIWTYGGRYDDPETTIKIQYVNVNKVIMMASAGRLDATFGAIPTFGNPAAGILPFMPPRISSTTNGIDMFVNAWLTGNREQLMYSAGSRPLMIPTAIDTFGCLLTIAP